VSGAAAADGSPPPGEPTGPVGSVRTVLHVDLDAFYASVEQLDDPALRGRPVVVAGLGGRGVVAASSYEARAYGIYSAMPTAYARRLCPDAVFVAPRFDAYQERSAAVMGILHDVTPLVEPISLDEAFLDVTGALRRSGDGPTIAAGIRSRVLAETGLVISVGVAPTKLLAKLASDLAKPDGMLVVAPGEELAFLHPLPVQGLWGVGPATHRRLERLGVVTVGDLARVPVSVLEGAVGKAHGRHLAALARNDDTRPVEPDREVKSVGHEETFPADVRDRERLTRELRRMSDLVGGRLRTSGRSARTVHVKAKYGDFRLITRAHTLTRPTNLGADIAATAVALLDRVDIDPGLRLLGVSVSGFETPGPEQLTLDSLAETGDGVAAGRPGDASRAAVDPETTRALELTLDAVRARFGIEAVGRAANATDRGVRVERRGSNWGPDDDGPAPPARTEDAAP
jgi:DNA polymerase-4